ncbi:MULTISPECIES: YdgH/BhsA/McbA family protein [Tenebrionibacter/Tenebrionicola group]|jgi:hypothetical protein|uniref:DUF1471 domain-containing protein n=2 Tax=Tenebrionibacter/Tenebrionicola group TaxID=2969848 RepID=A0A8K0XWU1_9ENTR|nr:MULTISPECIES: DUF1471 domain-containing protein [Tenebrionibacter/Tenebrionicola group]MBK4715576.1 DUF1471 domain-containing protein [Tenebrionibacter intestinalis]MBV4411378.1 DUF1471 domain-containing protein [Tenebrionicola larvae]MBV5095819.1 DUF1471 domain-containing protein [Tenebrionicola larvae]
MKKTALIACVMMSAVSFSAFAATQISKDEADHFKLTSLGNVNVSTSGGTVSSPSDLHNKLSKLADDKGGQYYRIIAAREHGPNFVAVAEVYKDARQAVVK